mgnify:CR=1 FL=1
MFVNPVEAAWLGCLVCWKCKAFFLLEKCSSFHYTDMELMMLFVYRGILGNGFRRKGKRYEQ